MVNVIAEGPYQQVQSKLIPPAQLSFTDSPTSTNTYYRLTVIDKFGEERAVSFPYLVQLEDNAPPSAPIGITGNISPKGLATLSWQSNQEADLLGYRVFKANKTDEEFVEITQSILNQPQFVDSVNLQTLTGQVYYKIVAVDGNYNPSAYSAALQLARPDLIAPAAAIFRRVELKGDTIHLEWDNSPSGDISFYEIYRQEKVNMAAIRIREWFPKDSLTYFKDTRAQLGHTYRYLLKCHDKAGNMTEVISKDLYFETGIRPGVNDWHATVDWEQRRIVLKWQYYSQLEIIECQIYRSKVGELLRLYKTITGNPGEFIDKDLSVNNVYHYRIKLNGRQGVQTTLSEAIKIEY